MVLPLTSSVMCAMWKQLPVKLHACLEAWQPGDVWWAPACPCVLWHTLRKCPKSRIDQYAYFIKASAICLCLFISLFGKRENGHMGNPKIKGFEDELPFWVNIEKHRQAGGDTLMILPYSESSKCFWRCFNIRNSFLRKNFIQGPQVSSSPPHSF